MFVTIFVITDENQIILLFGNEEFELAFSFFQRFFGISIDFIWTFQTEVGRSIRISFSSFKTADQSDLLRAGDGNDSTDFRNVFFVWSGTRKPPDLFSSGHEIWLRFISPEFGVGFGISLTATSVPSSGMYNILFVYV